MNPFLAEHRQSGTIILRRFRLRRQIGSGSFGVVYKGVDETNNNIVAVKVISRNRMNETPALKTLVDNEIKALSLMNCQHIVKSYGHYKSKELIFIVMEFCNGGELLTHMVSQPGRVYSESQAIEFFIQILAAYAHMVEKGVLHRDIKLENILLHNGQLKVVDFGFCKMHDPNRLNQSIDKTVLGSPSYMAPEILEGKSRIGIKAEVFSLGVLFYIMLIGKTPFAVNSNGQDVESRLAIEIKKQNIKFDRNDGQTISEQTQNLIRSMLKYKVEERIQFRDVITHPIFQKLRDLTTIRPAGLQNIEFPNPNGVYQDVNFQEIEQIQEQVQARLPEPKKSKIEIQKSSDEDEKEDRQDQIDEAYDFDNSNPDETIDAVTQLRQFYEFELNLLIYLAGNLYQLQDVQICYNNSRSVSEALILKYVYISYTQLSESIIEDSNHFDLPNFGVIKQLNQYKNFKNMFLKEYIPNIKQNYETLLPDYLDRLQAQTSFDTTNVVRVLQDPSPDQTQLQYYYDFYLRAFVKETQRMIDQLDKASEMHLKRLWFVKLNAVQCINIRRIFKRAESPQCFIQMDETAQKAFNSSRWLVKVQRLIDDYSQ